MPLHISSGGAGIAAAGVNPLLRAPGSPDAAPVPAPDPSAVPLHSLWISFLVILVSEIGDKTFLIAAVMAMRHARITVFAAAVSALAAMTALSAALGRVVPAVVSRSATQFAASALFVVFAVRMLADAWFMDPATSAAEEFRAVQTEIDDKEREEEEATKGGLPAPAQAPSRRSPSPSSSGSGSGWRNLANYLLTPVFVETFVLTFLAEWGDRSQIATIALASADDVWRVTVGSLLGHSLCTGLAVLGGRLVAAWISVRTVTIIGAALFLVFGIIGLYEWAYGYQLDD
ncbi:hypothetical protein HK405_012142 [Cladochytrium tenue]|nr:hypothetical protein HK405_012142 [Cladochytrium tenue]